MKLPSLVFRLSYIGNMFCRIIILAQGKNYPFISTTAEFYDELAGNSVVRNDLFLNLLLYCIFCAHGEVTQTL
jgi:hypothetical protein